MSLVRVFIIVAQLSLGGLFIYAGVNKFIPKPPKTTTIKTSELPDKTEKLRSFISGMKWTGYFWTLLGVGEILCGILLISQYFALLGAVMLVPMTLNIFLFHVFLKPEDMTGMIMSGLYLIGNLVIIGYRFPELKMTFLNLKLIK